MVKSYYDVFLLFIQINSDGDQIYSEWQFINFCLIIKMKERISIF